MKLAYPTTKRGVSVKPSTRIRCSTPKVPKRKQFVRRPRPDAPERPTIGIWKQYIKAGEGSALEATLVEQHIPLVRAIAGRLAMTLPSHVSADDLYSAGLVGLLNAIRRYKPDSGTAFETYARVRIRGTIVDELRRLDWVPRSVHDKARKVEKVMRQIEQEKGEVATELEMAKALKMSLPDYHDLLETIKPATFVCLDSVRGNEDDGASRYESMADDKQVEPDKCASIRELGRLATGRLQQLPEMQRKVLALYYFEDLRLREIAEIFGVTESRICQIHAQAILVLRSFLNRQNAIAA